MHLSMPRSLEDQVLATDAAATRNAGPVNYGSLPSVAYAVTDGGQLHWDHQLLTFSDSTFDQANFLGKKLWGAGKLSHLVLRQNGHVVSGAQVYLFQLPGLPTSGGVAYVKFGPLWRPVDTQPDTEMYRKTCEALIEEYAVRRRLCLTIVPGPDPVYGADQSRILGELGFLRHRDIKAAHRYLVNVSLTLSEQRKSLSSKWRYNLKKSEKNDLEVAFHRDDEARDAFRELHEEMRARKRYEEATWVDDYDALVEEIPERMQPTIALARHQGRPVASAIIGCIGDTAIYLFGGSSSEGLKLRAGYKLQWDIVRQLTQDPKVHWYDLDNDAYGNHGLRQFKSGLVGRRGIIYELPGEFEYCLDWRSRFAANLIQGLRGGRNLARKILGKEWAKFR